MNQRRPRALTVNGMAPAAATSEIPRDDCVGPWSPASGSPATVQAELDSITASIMLLPQQFHSVSGHQNCTTQLSLGLSFMHEPALIVRLGMNDCGVLESVGDDRWIDS
jgi:hypothetical protein